MTPSDSAEYLTSPLLSRAGFRHAFFTRRGGVSEGAFRSLNFSIAAGDDPDRVAENLVRAGRALGVDPTRIFFLSQVHGRAVAHADGSEARDSFVRREGDIVVGSLPNLACAVRSADCVPVLLADRVSGYVAAVHAGWRGVAGRAVEAGVTNLKQLVGGRAELIAAIGPHISLDSFEVSEDVARELLAASPIADVVDYGKRRPHVDLRRIVRAQLASLGLESDAIDDVWGCTVRDEAQFFSFRRDGAASGRLLSAIVPRGA
ncbi:MAG TPA: peptidoglycan editing factor PgeF [Polyangiaceae bacterium]|nr:peptidoglycan editing factor PgeF [Polyangiaceae bacterium]